MSLKQELMGNYRKDIDITTDNNSSLLRLLHLVSPTLPTGAFSYSQGLEWAVENGWVHDKLSLQSWLTDLMELSLCYVDLPILNRMYKAVKNKQDKVFEEWCALLIACRETAELRMEERTRGRALASLLQSLDVPGADAYQHLLKECQLAGFALAAVEWNISLPDAALGYSWAWLENQVLAGMKIIPLGQTDGQRLLLQFNTCIAGTVEKGLLVADDDIGSAAQALAIACSLHETQYTRLYRS